MSKPYLSISSVVSFVVIVSPTASSRRWSWARPGGRSWFSSWEEAPSSSFFWLAGSCRSKPAAAVAVNWALDRAGGRLEQEEVGVEPLLGDVPLVAVGGHAVEADAILVAGAVNIDVDVVRADAAPEDFSSITGPEMDLPQINISWSYNPVSKTISVNIQQAQKTIFQFPLEIEIKTRNGSALHTLQIEKEKQSFEIPVKNLPVNVIADPEINLLATFKSRKMTDQ